MRMPTRELRIRARGTRVEISRGVHLERRANKAGKGNRAIKVPGPPHRDRDQVPRWRTPFRAVSSTDSAKTANWRPIARVQEASARRLIVQTRGAWDLERPTSMPVGTGRRLAPQGNKISSVGAIAAMAAAHPHHQLALPIRQVRPSIEVLLRARLRKVGVAVAALSAAEVSVEDKSVQ